MALPIVVGILLFERIVCAKVDETGGLLFFEDHLSFAFRARKYRGPTVTNVHRLNPLGAIPRKSDQCVSNGRVRFRHPC